jgi:hypothetical protein
MEEESQIGGARIGRRRLQAKGHRLALEGRDLR